MKTARYLLIPAIVFFGVSVFGQVKILPSGVEFRHSKIIWPVDFGTDRPFYGILVGNKVFTKYDDPYATGLYCPSVPENTEVTWGDGSKHITTDYISLNAVDIPQGTVTVYSGGELLTENKDYRVDYTLGRVKIINPGIANSGSVIRIQVQSNTKFNINVPQKSSVKSQTDLKFKNDLYLGNPRYNY